MKSKNKKALNDFVQYCKKHPEQRFWQALRNWSGYSYIFGGSYWSDKTKDGRLEDTYYKEGK